MANMNREIDRIVQTVKYQGVDFEVVARPDVLWVGCLDYAVDGAEESDIDATLRRYREALIDVTKRGLIRPDWSAALSINYDWDGAPNGLMFAQEVDSADQDPRYELFTQPGGLWLRLRNGPAAAGLLGKERADLYEYFAQEQVLQKAAAQNGYRENPDVHVQVEYNCHAEYGSPDPSSYAYIPIVRTEEI